MIQSLLRALELLEYLKEPAHDYTIAELADALQLPRSTVHRMLQTFCEKRFVVRDLSLIHIYPALCADRNPASPCLVQLSGSESGLESRSASRSLPLLRWLGI